eukprot:682460_1
MACASTPANQEHFMILFDTETSPNNEYAIACSTYGDIFVWNMSSILNKSIGRQDPKQFDDNDNNDSDNDYGQSAHTIGTDNAPSFVFRPFPKDIVGAVYRLQTIKNLLFVATFEALYIYRWNDILDAIGAVHTSSNHTTRLSIEAMHRYIAPQIEYEHGAKSRYVEVNALAHHGGRDSLFLGTGHCAIFELNLNKLELMNRLNGHSDYVLDLSVNECVLSSASNDGTVKQRIKYVYLNCLIIIIYHKWSDHQTNPISPFVLPSITQTCTYSMRNTTHKATSRIRLAPPKHRQNPFGPSKHVKISHSFAEPQIVSISLQILQTL